MLKTAHTHMVGENVLTTFMEFLRRGKMKMSFEPKGHKVVTRSWKGLED